MSPSFTLESVLIAKGDSFCSSRQMGRSLRFCGSAGQPAWIASLFIASLQRCAKLVYPGDGYRISGISRSWFAERTAFLFSALWHWLRSHSSSWHFSAYLLDSWVLYFEQKENKGEQKTKNVHYLREGNIFARTCISMRTSGHQWQICFSNPNALFSCSPHYSIFYLLYRLPFSSGQFMEPPLLALVTQYFTAASMSWSDNYELTEILDLTKF